jgi:hypothetical protein
MSTIGGPGGIGGPKGPTGPDGPEDIAGPDDVAAEPGVAATGQAVVDQLAAEIAAGRLTPREAVDQLVELTAGPELGQAERAELRQLLTDLVANDPYLSGLVGRV